MFAKKTWFYSFFNKAIVLNHGSSQIRNSSLIKGLMRRYADLRVGATRNEKRLYKESDSIVLSFDDWGTKKQVRRLLAILETEQVKAAFFVQGDWAQTQPALIREIKRAGHFIGNHTYSHQDLLSLSDSELTQEMLRGPKSLLLRPPMGRYNRRVRRLAKELGMALGYWTIDSDDWRGTSIEAMRQKILQELHPGAVILFHMHVDATADMLEELIADIRSRGYDIMQDAKEVAELVYA